VFFAFLILSVGFVAFTNGANANFKGVASLYGSGTTSLKTALWWGTFTTLAGSIAALFLADGLLKKFSGKGLVSDELLQSPTFTSAVAAGAALTSFLATRLGFPVSTTHALVGALVGAGLAGGGEHVHLSALGKNFLYPLFFSPLLAIVLGAVVYWALRSVHLVPDQRNRLLDVAHFATAGAASFARGLNDTPKMATLLLIVPGFSIYYAMLFIGIIVAIGAMIDAKRVAETLGKKVTGMTPGQGFAANLVTAILVTTASFHSVPVSTTHVSVGSLLGMGASTKQAKWRKVIEILLAWITTVPCGAILAAIAYSILRLVVTS
jgi:inorganic phosphate transporter, PiT family